MSRGPDIALIGLSEPLPIGPEVMPLCLPDENHNDLNQTLHASGYGVQRIENEQDQYPQV